MNLVTRALGSPTADWIIRVLVVLGTIIGVTVAIQQRELSDRQKSDVACISRWASEYSRVEQIREGAQATRLNALHILILDAAEKKDKATIEEDVALFISTETNYQKEIAAHPLPLPPAIHCEP